MELNKTLIAIVRKWATKTQSKMRAILVSKGKSQSNIIKQLKIKVLTKNNTLEIKTDLPDYAKFVDAGRKPGKQPPLKTIESWCKSKGIPVSAAFPIARKIGENGLKPTNFLAPFKTFKDLIAELKKTTADGVKQIIKEENKKK